MMFRRFEARPATAGWDIYVDEICVGHAATVREVAAYSKEAYKENPEWSTVNTRTATTEMSMETTANIVS